MEDCLIAQQGVEEGRVEINIVWLPSLWGQYIFKNVRPLGYCSMQLGRLFILDTLSVRDICMLPTISALGKSNADSTPNCLSLVVLSCFHVQLYVCANP